MGQRAGTTTIQNKTMRSNYNILRTTLFKELVTHMYSLSNCLPRPTSLHWQRPAERGYLPEHGHAASGTSVPSSSTATRQLPQVTQATQPINESSVDSDFWKIDPLELRELKDLSNFTYDENTSCKPEYFFLRVMNSLKYPFLYLDSPGWRRR